MLSWGFQNSKSNTSLFVYKVENTLVILLVYVDDILIIGTNPKVIEKLTTYLNKTFALKLLGSLHYFLSIEAFQSDIELYLTQSKYIVDLLKKTKKEGVKAYSTLAAPGKTLSRDEGEAIADPTVYRSTIGALQYLTVTRYDISYIVSKLNQF